MEPAWVYWYRYKSVLGIVMRGLFTTGFVASLLRARLVGGSPFAESEVHRLPARR